jgi:hypothetical protein
VDFIGIFADTSTCFQHRTLSRIEKCRCIIGIDFIGIDRPGNFMPSGLIIDVGYCVKPQKMVMEELCKTEIEWLISIPSGCKIIVVIYQWLTM